MAEDGGEREEATKLDRMMRNHEMNQHVTGRNLTRAHILCDPVAIVQLNCRQIPIKLQLLQPDRNLPPNCKLRNPL